MGGPTGNGATEATASSPARAPALALLDGRGEVVRLTETFRAGFAPEGSPHLSIWDFLADPDQRSRLGRVLDGAIPRVDLALPSAAGSVAAEAEAVLDAAVMRHVLLTVAPADPDPGPRSGVDILLSDPSLEASPAIVWIKDLSGRYVRINRRYTERLGIDAATIQGKSDAELSPAQVVAEPRPSGHQSSGAEPAQLEYTVQAVPGREALTVLRFPIHDLDGAAVAVCGVAAAVTEAGTARSEAERLLRMEHWAGLSVAAIRAELIEEWQLAEVETAEAPDTLERTGEPHVAPNPERPAAAEAVAAADSAEFDRLRGELEAAHAATAHFEERLGEERADKAQLETRLAAEATRVAELAGARARAEAAERELAGARARVLELEGDRAGGATLERELAGQRGRAEKAERDVAALRARAEAAERDVAAARARAEAAEHDVAAARARVNELERAGSTTAAAVEQAGAEHAARVELEHRLGVEQRRADEAERYRSAELAEVERARAKIASMEGALATMKTENEAATATARETTARIVRQRTLAASSPAVPVAPVAGPTWNPGAQRALAASLADAAEWRAGLKDALRVLGQEGGWDVAVAWCPDERATALRCVAMWMSTPDQLHLFETATWQRRQAPTTSAVGRAAAGGHSHWIGDLTRVDDAQLAAAAGEGMRAALHVPMRHGGETSGVLELLTHAPITPNPEIAAAMEAVALQLAHFEYLLRRGAEPRWRLGRL